MLRPKVTIVVLNWNGWQDTIACLQSLQGVTYPNFQVVVVDNGSEKEDLIQLRQWKGFVTLLENEKNLGFSGGNNVGIRYALEDPKTQYVLIQNNDTLVAPEFLTEMVSAAESKGVDMVSPTVLAYGDRKTVDRLGIIISKALLAYDMKCWEGKEPFCPSGCCALYSRRLLEEIELDGEYFDEDFFAYCEDVDLGIQAVLLGYRAALAPNAVIYHKGSASTFLQSPFSLYYGHRNTIWYLVKSVPAATLLRHSRWILAGQILTVIANVRKRRGLFILKAKLAGLFGIPRMLRKRRAIQGRRKLSVQAMERVLDPRHFYLFAPRALRYLKNLVRVQSTVSGDRGETTVDERGTELR